MGKQPAPTDCARAITWKVWIWPLIAVAFAAIAWAAAARHWISCEMIFAHRASLVAYVSTHLAFAIAAFLVVYVLLALLLFPAQLWVIAAGAFVFGLIDGAMISWIGAILGALAVFIAARGVLRRFYRERVGSVAARIDAEFSRDATLYMLALRWLPISPYCVANAVPPLLGASPWPYMAVAVVGVLPDVITYSLGGAALSQLAACPHRLDLGFVGRTFLPVLLVVGVSPLLAIVVRRLLASRGNPVP